MFPFTSVHDGSPTRETRWLPCINTSDIVLPGFSLVALDVADGAHYGSAGYFAQSVIDNEPVWRVSAPNGQAVNLQQPALLAVLGPQPLPPYNQANKGPVGHCTQDWPAQVLEDGAFSKLSVGQACGPAAGAYTIRDTGDAFVCMGQDAGRGIRGTADGKHTVWIAPAVPNNRRYAVYATNDITTLEGTQISGDTRLVITGNELVVPSPSSTTNHPEFDSDILALDQGEGNGSSVSLCVAIRKAGLYRCTFSATLSSADAARGTPLSIWMYLNDDAIGRAYRLQDIEKDHYGNAALTTQENVSFTLPVYVEESDMTRLSDNGAGPSQADQAELSFQSRINDTLNVSQAHIWVERITPYSAFSERPDPTGTLTYDNVP